MLHSLYCAVGEWWDTLSPRTQGVIAALILAACILLTGYIDGTAPEGMYY